MPRHSSAREKTFFYLLAHFLVEGAVAQAAAECPASEMSNVVDIISTCCESRLGGCSASFPATCVHTCASLVVPYVDSCGTILNMMPDGMFTTFQISGCVALKPGCSPDSSLHGGRVFWSLRFQRKGLTRGSCLSFGGRLMAFADACRQTLVLYEGANSAASCTASHDTAALQSRVDLVNAACCEQAGTNTCVGGAPQTCASCYAINFFVTGVC